MFSPQKQKVPAFVNLVQSGSAPMVTAFLSSVSGGQKRVTSTKGENRFIPVFFHFLHHLRCKSMYLICRPFDIAWLCQS